MLPAHRGRGNKTLCVNGTRDHSRFTDGAREVLGVDAGDSEGVVYGEYRRAPAHVFSLDPALKSGCEPPTDRPMTPSRSAPCPRPYVPVGEEGVETGTPDVKEAFDTALDLPADDPDYLAGNPMLEGEHPPRSVQ